MNTFRALWPKTRPLVTKGVTRSPLIYRRQHVLFCSQGDQRMNENEVGQVSNLSSEGHVEPRPSETPTRSVSEAEHEPQPPAPQTDQVSGHVENLPHDDRQAGRLPHVLDRIRTHPDLSPGMRQRLSELVQRQPPAEGPTQIPLD